MVLIPPTASSPESLCTDEGDTGAGIYLSDGFQKREDQPQTFEELNERVGDRCPNGQDRGERPAPRLPLLATGGQSAWNK